MSIKVSAERCCSHAARQDDDNMTMDTLENMVADPPSFDLDIAGDSNSSGNSGSAQVKEDGCRSNISTPSPLGEDDEDEEEDEEEEKEEGKKGLDIEKETSVGSAMKGRGKKKRHQCCTLLSSV